MLRLLLAGVRPGEILAITYTRKAAREIEAANLQRNAALCLESAQGQLGTGEFPPDAYRSAREALARALRDGAAHRTQPDRAQTEDDDCATRRNVGTLRRGPARSEVVSEQEGGFSSEIAWQSVQLEVRRRHRE